MDARSRPQRRPATHEAAVTWWLELVADVVGGLAGALSAAPGRPAAAWPPPRRP